VDRHVQAGPLLQGVQGGGDFGDGLVAAVERGAQDGDDADGVLVDELTASSPFRWNRPPSMGTSRGSTSK